MPCWEMQRAFKVIYIYNVLAASRNISAFLQIYLALACNIYIYIYTYIYNIYNIYIRAFVY